MKAAMGLGIVEVVLPEEGEIDAAPAIGLDQAREQLGLGNERIGVRIGAGDAVEQGGAGAARR